MTLIPRIDIPEGQSGEWTVSRFEVSQHDADFHNLRASINPRRMTGHIQPGTYTQLKRGSTLVMSDTPSEIRDHRDFVLMARGHVLVTGLGLGVVTNALALKDRVEHVTVIEKSADVIKLVGPFFKDNSKVTIIHADAFTWQPPRGARFDCAWHDIWDDICESNRKEMTRLRRRYCRRVTPRRQQCWSQEQLDCMRGR